MAWFSLLVDSISESLAHLGVPEAYRSMTALGILYVTAILLVAFVIFLLLRRTRHRPKERPEEERETPAAEPLEEEPAEAEPEVAVEPEPVSPLERMREGLAKTQASLVGRIDELLRGKREIDEELLEEIEEVLVTADVGVKTTQDIVRSLEERLGRQELQDAAALRAALKEEMARRLHFEAEPLNHSQAKPFVIMVVGVNGVGKTTTIGKLARRFTEEGKSVILGAGDTFRAAAVDQLSIWSERTGVDIIRHDEGSDPAAVAFDAIKAARAREIDVLILDTAGRLHTQVNLMEELKKVHRVLGREMEGAPHETLLVLDATTGQNALTQARLFHEAVDITGIALTKLDGTSRGGIVVAIGEELGVPVRYVGIGEKAGDLRSFDPDLFVEALFPEAR
ncbi:MAG: signal recognition particle-docking protein FtsY [Desulfuromonadales bacterium]